MAHNENNQQGPGLIKRMTGKFNKMVSPEKIGSVKDIRSKEKVLQQGYLRKRNTGALGKAMEKMNFRWKRFYIIVTDQFIYYFQSDMSNKLVGKFSLYGYNVVKRLNPDVDAKIPEYAITVEHASRDPSNKNYFFAASYDEECMIWLKAIRTGLLAANSRLLPNGGSGSPLSPSSLEDPIYPSESFLKSNTSQEQDDIDSTGSDYSYIKDIDLDSPPIRPPKPTPNSSIVSPTESYIDFGKSKDLKQIIPHRHQPLPPLPQENNNEPLKPAQSIPSPSAPSPSTYQHHQHPLSPPIGELKTALADRLKHNATTPPMEPGLRPPPQPTKPFVKQKPVLPVKPMPVKEKLFWNRAKDEGNRVIRAAPRGVFLVRKGSDGRLVLVLSAGQGAHHSLHVTTYYDQRMGLKSEIAAQEADRFTDLESLVAYYKEHDILLQNGAVKIRLVRAHQDCEDRLDS